MVYNIELAQREKKRENGETNFFAGWYVYEKSEIEYIIYVNKTAIRICVLFDLLTWVACGTFPMGKREQKKKKKQEKNGQNFVWDGPKGKPTMYKSKSFSIRKMATVTGKNMIFAYSRLRGRFWSASGRTFLRETDRQRRLVFWQLFDTKNITWHVGHPVFRCILYLLFFFLFPFLMNSFDMTYLPDFKLFFPPEYKNTYNIICTLYILWYEIFQLNTSTKVFWANWV